MSGSWCPDVSSVFIARIGASATIERLHAKSIQKSDLPVIFLSLLIGQTPLRIWCCFEESIAVEEREKGTLEYCLIILLLSNIRDGFLHGFFYLFVTLCQIFLSLLSSSYPCGSFQEPSTAGCGSHRRWARPCHH